MFDIHHNHEDVTHVEFTLYDESFTRVATSVNGEWSISLGIVVQLKE